MEIQKSRKVQGKNKLPAEVTIENSANGSGTKKGTVERKRHSYEVCD